MAEIRVRGVKDDYPVDPDDDLGALSDDGFKAQSPDLTVTATNSQTVLVGTARAGAKPVALEGLAPDSLIELTLHGGFKLWTSYQQLAEDLPTVYSRGATRSTGAIDLPETLPGPASRGGGTDLVIETVRSFDLDIAGLAGTGAGRLAANKIASRLDRWRVEKPGLFRWTGPTDMDEHKEIFTGTPPRSGGDAPLLLFIHGTGSSTAGSFGDLRTAARPEDAWRRASWDTLATAYGDRILSYDHHTLAVSPLKNAIELVEALPAGARLHMVSHSRGGMIGELLCRAQRSDGKKPFEDDEIEKLKVLTRRLGNDDGHGELLIEELRTLGELLWEKKPIVERFVRVACPAAGTTMASERLDRWLSLSTSLLDLTGLKTFATYRCLKGFLMAVVKERTNPRTIPGLEAMMPGSLVTNVLNRPGVQTDADLSVIAGDIEGGSLLARLALRVGDWFYGGDHDLVVDTFSMYGGLSRSNGARVFFDRGASVSHFSYFSNPSTVERLVAALRRGTSDDAGFTALARPNEIDQRVYQRRDGAARPTVFVLPGLMGSHLGVNGNRIWLDPIDIARGRLDEIGIGEPKVEAQALVADAYAGLVEHLKASHDVRPFPYDWRKSLKDEAERLAVEVRERLIASRQPVHLIGHSMGGLLALAAFARHPDLWDDFRARAGCRLLLAGTPCRGSYAIVRTLLGQERLMTYLHLLDLTHGEDELLALVAKFPGLLELLPADGPLDLFDPDTWASFQAIQPKRMAVPDGKDLKAARETRSLIESLKLDPSCVVYLAGTGPATPAGLSLDAKEIRFVGTVNGDGRVPWDTGIPEKLRRWYADAEHGALCNHQPAFEAIVELLQSGTTTRLPATPPVRLRGAALPVFMPEEQPSVFPNEAELAAAALGYQQRQGPVERPRTRIQVVHGNLANARWPVAVGHYNGDTIMGSEAHLDRALKGRLSRRHALGLYPDALEMAEIVLDPLASPRGAVVIGLGNVGELTAGTLRRTFAHGLRRYKLQAAEDARMGGGRIGLSVLLIGTGTGGIAVRDAVTATLEAVVLTDAVEDAAVLDELEFIELYEDRAIQAANAACNALEDERFSARLEFEPREVKTSIGGRRRAAPEEDVDWWHRLQITLTDDPIPSRRKLEFTAMTDRARAEVSPMPDQRIVAERFIRRAVLQERQHGDTEDPARTLFELLYPVRLKDQARRDRNHVLVLDTETASYPWELLRDGDGTVEPPAVRAGMVRQLVDQQFRDRPAMAVGDTALVIGDPPSGLPEFPPLEGAKMEAELVGRMLSRSAFLVTERIRLTPEANLGALLNRSWRVLHIAGHGDVNFPSPVGPMTGMVLGDGLFLTPSLINQLSAVPDLVFLNCCHLGKVDAKAERSAGARFHELAANLATQFIKLGVRAVVAAGWAVDDAAALLFAKVFYELMLDDKSFGEAVWEARRRVYDQYPHTNTWGAYQCYGDYAFRLKRGSEPRPSERDRPFTHPGEAVAAFDDIAQDAQTMVGQDPAKLADRYEKVMRRTPKCFKDKPEVLTAAGTVCGELGRLDEAVEYLTKALAAERSMTPVRTIEQLADLRARRAVIEAMRNSKPDDEAIKKAMNEIKAAIKTLDGMADIMEASGLTENRRDTVARLSLLGDCQKRLALISPSAKPGDKALNARDVALKAMTDAYKKAHKKAHDLNEQAGGALSYPRAKSPLLGWLLGATLQHVRGRVELVIGVEEWLERIALLTRPADQLEPSVWNLVTLGDVLLGQHLLKQDIVESPNQMAVIEAYLRAWNRGTSPLGFSSVLENIEFTIAMLSDGTKDTASGRAKLRSAMRSIADRLSEETGVR